MVGDDLQNSVETRVHVSSVAKWVTGLGEQGLFEFFPQCTHFNSPENARIMLYSQLYFLHILCFPHA